MFFALKPFTSTLTTLLATTALVVGYCRAQTAETAPPSADNTEEQTEDQVLVIVDGKEFTASQAQQRIGMRLRSLQNRMPPQQLQAMIPQLSKQVVEEFIAQTLLNKEADKKYVEVSDEEMTEAIDDLKKRLPPDTTLEQALEKEGLSMEELRKNVLRDRTIRKLIEDNVETEFEITDDQIAEFYKDNQDEMKAPETVHARHILVEVEDKDDKKAVKKARKKAEAIKKKLDNGADFAEVAKEESSCPSSANGGDLGTFGRGQMVPSFDEAAFAQEVNEIGDIVETKFGFHVIQVLEHNDAGVPPLDDVTDRIKAHLENRKRGEAFASYIESLKEGVKIEYPGKD